MSTSWDSYGTIPTGNDVIEEIEAFFLSGAREEMNRLSGDIDETATSITLGYDLGALRSNALIDIGMETMRVWDADTDAKTATVSRGMNGTVAASHSDGDFVYTNPRLSRPLVFKALNNELVALGSLATGLFQVATSTFPYSGAVTDYEIDDTGITNVYDVRMSVPGPSMDWVSIPNWSWKARSNVASFPTGNVIHIPNGIPGRGIELVYKKGFFPLPTPESTLDASGLLPEMQDIPTLGVLLRLGPLREVRRNFTDSQGDTRRAEEVPANAVSTSFNAIRIQYRDRIAAEAARLSLQYPEHHR